MEATTLGKALVFVVSLVFLGQLYLVARVNGAEQYMSSVQKNQTDLIEMTRTMYNETRPSPTVTPEPTDTPEPTSPPVRRATPQPTSGE